MKNSRNRSGNIFASIREEEEKAENAKKSVVDTQAKNSAQVDSAIKKPKTLAESTNEDTTPEIPTESVVSEKVPETVSESSGINYLNQVQNTVEEPVNNGLLYITPTRKKTRNHRKGFLLSDLALKNLQNEAAKYEISENELINQILEKMI